MPKKSTATEELLVHASSNHIIIGWWDKEYVEELIEAELSEEEWKELANSGYSWDSINDQIIYLSQELIEKRPKQKEEVDEQELQLWDTETEQDNGSNILSTGTND